MNEPKSSEGLGNGLEYPSESKTWYKRPRDSARKDNMIKLRILIEWGFGGKCGVAYLLNGLRGPAVEENIVNSVKIEAFFYFCIRRKQNMSRGGEEESGVECKAHARCGFW
jgi:hypothetical protein